MNNAGAAAQDTAHTVPCHPHASREGARVPARACPRVLGTSTAGTGRVLFPDAASFCSSPAGSDVTASRIAGPGRQRAELPRVPETPLMETSKPEILEHFTNVSALLPLLTGSSFSFYRRANGTSKGRARRVAGSLSIWAAPGLLSPNPAATHPEVPESDFDEAPPPALQPQS